MSRPFHPTTRRRHLRLRRASANSPRPGPGSPAPPARKVIAALVIGAVVAACGGGADAEIPPQDPTAVEAGAVLYAHHCAECHGTDLRGSDDGPSFFSRVYAPNHHADAAFLLAVTRGARAHHWQFGDMLPVEGVTPEDVESIVAFVRERQRVEGFDP